MESIISDILSSVYSNLNNYWPKYMIRKTCRYLLVSLTQSSILAGTVSGLSRMISVLQCTEQCTVCFSLVSCFCWYGICACQNFLPE